jgi:hypothetical protein
MLSSVEVIKKTNQIIMEQGKNQGIMFLRRNDNKPLRMVLRYLLDKNIKFYRTDCPAFKPDSSSKDAPMSILDQEIRRFYIFETSYDDRCANWRRDQIMVQILEMLSSDEAELVAAILKRKNPYPKVTKALVVQAFPEMQEQNT